MPIPIIPIPATLRFPNRFMIRAAWNENAEMGLGGPYVPEAGGGPGHGPGPGCLAGAGKTGRFRVVSAGGPPKLRSAKPPAGRVPAAAGHTAVGAVSATNPARRPPSLEVQCP